MPRANRHYIPGVVWQVTHRCHKKEFVLKFARDRRRWLRWLFEAKKRFGLSVLNYMVTSKHIHLLLRDNGAKDVISKSIQLIAGRTGQEYDQMYELAETYRGWIREAVSNGKQSRDGKWTESVAAGSEIR